MRKLLLAVVVTVALVMAIGQAQAVEVDYEASSSIVKLYDGTTHVDWKFDGRLLFTELTLADRVKMELPLTKPNPDYDNKIPEDEITNPSTIPCTEEDTVYAFDWTENLGMAYQKKDVRAMIEEKCVNKRLEFIRKLEAIEPQTIIFNDFMKETLTAEKDLKVLIPIKELNE